MQPLVKQQVSRCWLTSVPLPAKLTHSTTDEAKETDTMKAFILERYGDKERVRAGEMPEPELRDDDVLVQVHARV